MLIGALIGLPTAAVGLVVCHVLNRLMHVPMRPYSDQAEPEPLEDDRLPSLALSLLPVLLPVVLITANTFAIWFAVAAHERRLREGEVLSWSRFSAQLSKVGTDGETAPARRIRELLPSDLEQSISDAGSTDSIDARLEAMLKAETWRLARQEHLLTDDAFFGIALPGEAGRILDRGMNRLPETDHDRFKTVYRDKALAGMANSERARELIDRGLEQLSKEEIERFNWLLLEAAFPGQRRVTIPQRIANLTAIIGNANLALFLAAVIAMIVLVRSRGLSLKQLAQSTEIALMSGGVIILITAGGGAFGAMLRAAGVQHSISQLVGSGGQGVGLTILLVAFAVASVIKFAQGSGTVSMITTASMFAAMGVSPEMLGCHPVYLAAAIGSGSLVGDWMNNSGFWIFARMSVLTEIETLKSWTILTACLGAAGLGFTLLLAWLMPMV
jgi:hypothetical protein